jgi:hypothetical protein
VCVCEREREGEGGREIGKQNERGRDREEDKENLTFY